MSSANVASAAAAAAANPKPKKNTNKFKTPGPNGKIPDIPAKTLIPAATQPAVKVQQTDDNNLQTKIYDAFLKLSKFNPTVRFEGIHEISSYYNAVDSKQNKTHNEYILNRLVKGLASNRKCSRLGFSCTLTELFNKFECLKFQTVLDIANKNLKFKLSDQSSKENKNALTKEEMRHMQIGLAFVYIAYIQSIRTDSIDVNDNSQLEVVSSLASDLNDMRKNKEIKPYIQQIYLQALILLVKKVSSEEIFTSGILPAIETDLKDNLLMSNFNQITDSPLVESATKNDLNLFLACMNMYSKSMNANLLTLNKLDFKAVLFSSGCSFFLFIILKFRLFY